MANIYIKYEIPICSYALSKLDTQYAWECDEPCNEYAKYKSSNPKVIGSQCIYRSNKMVIKEFQCNKFEYVEDNYFKFKNTTIDVYHIHKLVIDDIELISERQ